MNKNDLHDLHEEIDAHVQVVMRMIEKTHGQKVAKIVNDLLDEFITSAVEEAMTNGIHPGQVINAFIEVIVAVEASSKAMMMTHYGKHKHAGWGNN